MGKEYRTVRLEVELIKELEKVKHPGQSLNGIIRELLEKVKKDEQRRHLYLRP